MTRQALVSMTLQPSPFEINHQPERPIPRMIGQLGRERQAAASQDHPSSTGLGLESHCRDMGERKRGPGRGQAKCLRSQ